MGTYFKYHTGSGLTLVVLRLLILIWFVWCIHRTISQEVGVQKKAFFKQFGFSFGLWIFSFPLFVGISGLLAPWHSLKTSVALISTGDAAAVVVFAFLMNPSR